MLLFAAAAGRRAARGFRGVSHLAAAAPRLAEMRVQYAELLRRSTAGEVLGARDGRSLQLLEHSIGLEESLNVSRQEAKDLAEVAAMDDELREEASRELADVVEPRCAALEEELVTALLPVDDLDLTNSALLEVRASAGGDEAAMFAGDLFEMYQKYAVAKRWRWEPMSEVKTEFGGLKEAFAMLSGEGVYAALKFESGVHRVQRVPQNDARIHTSTATVVVLPQAEAQEVATSLPEGELRIDVYRSSGCGGQSVNTTDSAVRVTHIPTGTVVAIQDERSQRANKEKALRLIAARVNGARAEVERRERAAMRNDLGGSGDRSERIRTYNVPQDRVSDHRVGYTVNSVDGVLSGELLDDFLEELQSADRQRKLTQLVSDASSSKREK